MLARCTCRFELGNLRRHQLAGHVETSSLFTAHVTRLLGQVKHNTPQQRTLKAPLPETYPLAVVSEPSPLL